jgi:hypothetical protein
MVASHPINSAVAQWLLLFLTDPARLRPQGGAELACVVNGTYLVNNQALCTQDRWQRYVSNPRDVPSPRSIGCALSEFASLRRVQRKGVNYYAIDLPALLPFADAVGLTTDEVEAAIRNTPPVPG